jgi:organic hydroperoxide reductase OsmC/OhrA
MRIAALVQNTGRDHHVIVSTDGISHDLAISAKASGAGSSVNGEKFLMLALATCYCNDIYREAVRLSIPVDSVEVEATADFDGIGLVAKNATSRARVSSPASAADIEPLLHQTDVVAEVQNTVRTGVGVSLMPWKTAQSARPEGVMADGRRWARRCPSGQLFNLAAIGLR